MSSKRPPTLPRTNEITAKNSDACAGVRDGLNHLTRAGGGVGGGCACRSATRARSFARVCSQRPRGISRARLVQAPRTGTEPARPLPPRGPDSTRVRRSVPRLQPWHVCAIRAGARRWGRAGGSGLRGPDALREEAPSERVRVRRSNGAPSCRLEPL